MREHSANFLGILRPGWDITVAPFKLFRVQNNQYSNDPATKFAGATTNSLEEVTGLLCPKQGTFHSQDDITKVALGLPAASKQVHILMHMEYEVRLSDHDFTVAPMHNLMPSVMGVTEIKEKNIFTRSRYILWIYICSNHECQSQPIQGFT